MLRSLVMLAVLGSVVLVAAAGATAYEGTLLERHAYLLGREVVVQVGVENEYCTRDSGEILVQVGLVNRNCSEPEASY